MKHNWLYPPSRKNERTCLHCGKRQKYSLESYDRMTGSTYRWRPLAGKCSGERNLQVVLSYAKQIGIEDKANDSGSFNSDARRDIAFTYGAFGQWNKIPVEHQNMLLVAYRDGENHRKKLEKAWSAANSITENWTPADWEETSYDQLVNEIITMMDEDRTLIHASKTEIYLAVEKRMEWV